MEGCTLEWYVGLAEPVAVGVQQEITIKGEKTRLSAVKALERISYYVFFLFFLEADLCLSSVFASPARLIIRRELIEEVQVFFF